MLHGKREFANVIKVIDLKKKKKKESTLECPAESNLTARSFTSRESQRKSSRRGREM